MTQSPVLNVEYRQNILHDCKEVKMRLVQGLLSSSYSNKKFVPVFWWKQSKTEVAEFIESAVILLSGNFNRISCKNQYENNIILIHTYEQSGKLFKNLQNDGECKTPNKLKVCVL